MIAATGLYNTAANRYAIILRNLAMPSSVAVLAAATGRKMSIVMINGARTIMNAT